MRMEIVAEAERSERRDALAEPVRARFTTNQDQAFGSFGIGALLLSGAIGAILATSIVILTPVSWYFWLVAYSLSGAGTFGLLALSVWLKDQSAQK